jgi:hypothetical protein
MQGFKDFLDESLDADDIEEAGGMFKRVSRVRNGKVQRRKVVANKPGYKTKDGKVVRMTSKEKLVRKRAARIAARKRKSKVAQILRKRKITNRKRKSMGFDK